MNTAMRGEGRIWWLANMVSTTCPASTGFKAFFNCAKVRAESTRRPMEFLGPDLPIASTHSATAIQVEATQWA